MELRWNNPKIHKPQRRKVWLACEEHRESLSGFLGARNFLRDRGSRHRDATWCRRPLTIPRWLTSGEWAARTRGR